jgi:hypothetical protein
MLVAASLYLWFATRGKTLAVGIGVEIREPRKPVAYRFLPFAAQPRTIKSIDLIVRRRRDRFAFEVHADSKTYYGRLPEAPHP